MLVFWEHELYPKEIVSYSVLILRAVGNWRNVLLSFIFFFGRFVNILPFKVNQLKAQTPKVVGGQWCSNQN